MKHKFYTHEELPYHVTGHCKYERWPTDQNELWMDINEYLTEMYDIYNIITHSFTLMDNHFHWLCSPVDKEDTKNIAELFELINFSFKIHLINEVFNDKTITPIDNIKYYTTAYKYIYRNPVQAGLSQRVEDYPFSTLRQLTGTHLDCKTKVFDQMNFIYDSQRILNWLNSPSNQMDTQFIN